MSPEREGHGLYLGTAAQIEEWLAWPGRSEAPEGDTLDVDAYWAGKARPPQAFAAYAWFEFWYASASRNARDETYNRVAWVKEVLSSREALTPGAYSNLTRFPPEVAVAEKKAEEEAKEIYRTTPDRRIAFEARRQYELLEGRRLAQEQQARELAEKHRENWDELFLGESELDKLVVPPALIEGVLPVGCNAILRGRDGTYKTFVALDWALHVAAGLPWQGHPVEQGPVLYVAGEGAFGIRRRIAAWREFHKFTGPLPFTLRKAALSFYAPGEAFEHLLAWVEGRKVVLSVHDTLRRISGGAEENSSAMGAVVDSIEQVKASMAAVGGSTLTLSHTDKGDHDTRGFSGIEDDIDVVFHCRREEGTPFVTLLNTKQKDGPELSPVTLLAEPTGESLVLTGVMGAGGAGAEARILTFLTYETDEKDEGETAAVITLRTGMAKRTVIDALGRMTDRGDVVLTKATRPKKYAAAATLARFIGGER
jgi:hypothetical protein